MNEDPQPPLKHSQNDWKKVLRWAGILTGCFFTLIVVPSLIFAERSELPGAVVGGLVFSVALTTLGLAAVMFFRWLRRPRNFRRLLFGFTCLFTLIALFYAVENWRGKHAWTSYVREQEARGEKMDLAAFIPPPIPDDQNLALCPLFKPVLDFRYSNEQDRLENSSTPRILWLDTNGIARVQRLNLHWNMENHLNSLPGGRRSQFQERSQAAKLKKHVEANTLTNGWINFALWQDYYRLGTNLVAANPSNTPAQDVLFALRRVEPDLAELRQEAKRRPLARWPVRYDLEQPWGTILPHLARAKGITMLLQVRAAALLAADKTADGLADIELGFRLADTFDSEPFLISQLVRNVCYEILLQPLKEGLARHQLSDAQLSTLQRQLQSVDMLADYQRAMRCERSVNGLWARMSRENRDALVQSFQGASDRSDQISQFAKLSRGIPKGWIYQNQLVISRLYDEGILSAVDLQARTVSPGKVEAILNAKQHIKGPYSALVPLLMLTEAAFGETRPFAFKFALGQTQIDLARIACALERHHLAHGHYPKTLNELAPRFISSVPNDVINGQPLKYLRLDDLSFNLYSVGWNETDDGGKSLDSETATWKESDWVWSQPTK